MDGKNVVYEGGETNQEIIKDWLIEQRTVDAAVTPIGEGQNGFALYSLSMR